MYSRDMEQRSLLLFENSIKSQETVTSYKWYLKKFKEYFKLRDYDSMVAQEQKQIQEQVEDYVMDLKKRVNPNSVPTFVYPIKSFYEANDIDLKWKKILKLFPESAKKTGRESWSTEHIQKMLQVTKDIKNQTIIHFLASSACRIGALTDLKIRHVSEMQDGCKAVLIYEDTKWEYIVLLTPEASSILDQCLEIRKQDGEFVGPESSLFRAKYRLGIEKSRPMSKKSLESVVLRIARNAGLRNPSTKKKGRYDIQIDHGFRKRFNTILKLNAKIPVAITERLLGHKMYYDEIGNKIQLDDAYLTATKEQLFEKFKLAIPDLTINDTERLLAENSQKQEKITELSKKDNQIQELAKKIDEQQKRLDKRDKEEQLLRELGKLEKQVHNGMKNKTNDKELFGLMERRDRVEAEYNKIAYDD